MTTTNGKRPETSVRQEAVPVAHFVPDVKSRGEEWSWCQSRLNRLQYKKSIADAAVDGIVPTGHLRAPEQAFQDALGWLKRVEGGEITEIKRARIVVPLSDKPVDVERRASASSSDVASLGLESWKRHSSWDRPGAAPRACGAAHAKH